MAGVTKSKTHAILALIFFNPGRESRRDKEQEGYRWRRGEGKGRSLSGKETENPLTSECYRGKQSSSGKHSSFSKERAELCFPAGCPTVLIEEIRGY